MTSGADTAGASGDRAGLGRGPLTRWMPVFLQAQADPPVVDPFALEAGLRPGRFLARVLFSARRFTVPAALLAVVTHVGESAVPVAMGLAIDQALSAGDAVRLVLWLVLLAALFLVTAVASRFAQQLTEFATERVQHRLRATVSDRLLHPASSTTRGPDGGVVSAMTNDVGRLARIGLMVHPIGEVAAIVFIAVSLLLTHWVLGVVALIGAPLVVWLMGLLSERLSRDTRIYQGLLADTVGRATDLVAGYRVIKGVRAEAEATRRYREASQQTLQGARRNVGLLGRFLVGTSAISGIFVAGIAGLAGWFAVAGQLSIGGLIAAVGLTQALLPQVEMLAMNAVPSIAGARASAARLLEMLQGTGAGGTRTGEPEERREAGKSEGGPARASGREEGALPDEGIVSGGDAAVVPVLEIDLPSMTLRIEPGEFVVVRADDVAAAAFVDALLRPAGAAAAPVRLDGTPAAELAPTRYRSRVTVAPHRVTLFSGTVADNVAPGADGSGRRAAALHAAACDDFAGDPHLSVGEDGNRLSGGQRQRVALARAFATHAPVLVLHDPTTAVDSVTEALIAERIRGIRAGLSTIVVTASPALRGASDRVLDIDGGDSGAETGGHGAGREEEPAVAAEGTRA